jgi:hypothetical protein
LRIDQPTKRPSVPAAAQDDDAPLPHERDQAVGEVSDEPDPVIVQARRDIEAGLVDTDMRATPGLDAERRARLVARPDAEVAMQAADPRPPAVKSPAARRRPR